MATSPQSTTKDPSKYKSGIIWLKVIRDDGTDRGFATLIPDLTTTLSSGDTLELSFGRFEILNIQIDEYGAPIITGKQLQDFTIRDLYDAPEFTGTYGMAAG